jgi:ribosomal protein S18 acetylase RimI-like enzyme
VVGGSGGLRFVNGGDGALPESSGLAPALLGHGLRLTSRALVLQGDVWDTPPADGPAAIAPADDGGSCRATLDGGVVGECWVDPAAEFSSHPGARAHAFVQWIGTEEAWRGRGVGRQMWAFTCARLQRLGVRRLSLSTPCGNLAAQALYLRLGMRVVDAGLGWAGREAPGAPAAARPSVPGVAG